MAPPPRGSVSTLFKMSRHRCFRAFNNYKLPVMANGVTEGLLECAVLSGGAETPVLLSDIEVGVSR